MVLLLFHHGHGRVGHDSISINLTIVQLIDSLLAMSDSDLLHFVLSDVPVFVKLRDNSPLHRVHLEVLVLNDYFLVEVVDFPLLLLEHLLDHVVT